MSTVSGVSGVTVRPLYDSTDSLLRFAVRADATLTGLCGLAVAVAADPLSSLTGLTSFQEYIGGAFFVLYGLVVFSLGALPDLRRAGISIVAANAVFTLAAIVAAGVLPLTGAGVALTLASAAYTAAFAAVQYAGVRRLEDGLTAGRRRAHSLRSRSRLIEWSASLRSTRVARGRVGRMFSTRLGRLIERQISRAAATALVSLSAA